ncbi:hypothetical protein [Pseudomonas subflava]|uniref:hypothetical protein n=1 Tax=Pseudomonas subflava TaxID=2952933 RepID=UPI002079E076|nr:hypothetical protein [Pseudomonas subflava]
MNRLHCASYEAPLWRGNDSLHLEVLCQDDHVLLITLVFRGITQALYRPQSPSKLERGQAERYCRLAVGQFQASGIALIHEERRNPLQRPVHTLRLDATSYQGVLLSLPVAASA